MGKMKFTDHIRGLIKLSNASQANVAERAGISTAVMSRIVTGEREPNMDHAVAIAAALNVTVDELLRHTTAEHVTSKWVSKEAYASLELKAIMRIREAEELKARLNSELARMESLRASLWESEKRNMKLQIDIDELRAEKASKKVNHDGA